MPPYEQYDSQQYTENLNTLQTGEEKKKKLHPSKSLFYSPKKTDPLLQYIVVLNLSTRLFNDNYARNKHIQKREQAFIILG